MIWTMAIKWVLSFFFNWKKWLGWLSTHWKEALLFSIVGLFLYQMFSPYQFLFGLDTIPSLRKQLAKKELELQITKDNLVICTDSNKRLSDSIDKQNLNINMWGEISKKIDASTAEVKTKIDFTRKQTTNDVKSILNGTTPATCSEALDYLRNAITSGELTWKQLK